MSLASAKLPHNDAILSAANVTAMKYIVGINKKMTQERERKRKECRRRRSCRIQHTQNAEAFRAGIEQCHGSHFFHVCTMWALARVLAHEHSAVCLLPRSKDLAHARIHSERARRAVLWNAFSRVPHTRAHIFISHKNPIAGQVAAAKLRHSATVFRLSFSFSAVASFVGCSSERTARAQDTLHVIFEKSDVVRVRQFSKIIIIKRRSFTTLVECKHCKHDVCADSVACVKRTLSQGRVERETKEMKNKSSARSPWTRLRTRTEFNLLVLFRAPGRPSDVRFSGVQLLRVRVCASVIRFAAHKSTRLPNHRPNRTKSARAPRSKAEWGDAQANTRCSSTQQLINKRVRTLLDLLCKLKSTRADVWRSHSSETNKTLSLFSIHSLCGILFIALCYVL